MTDDESGDNDPGGDIGALARLLGDAEETIEKIESKADEEDLGPVLTLLDDLEDIVDEAEDVLSTIDLAELVAAIDLENLPDAIDLEDVPEAIQDRDVSEAVAVRELIDLDDLPELFDSVDERELWREKRELDDELDDVVGGETEQGDSADLDVDVGSGGANAATHDVDQRAIQTAVQAEISDAVGEFRESLLAAHDRLETLRRRNEERFDQQRNRSASRNPTAGFSTMPARRGGPSGTANHSTVPEETRYSTAPNRKRIYGDRFESAGGGDGG